MSNQKTITRLVPRIGKPPRVYKLVPWEFELTKSIDNCPIEHSHFIAEHCSLPGLWIEILLRYTKFTKNKSIQHCAAELGLAKENQWKAPVSNGFEYINLPKKTLDIKAKIEREMSQWETDVGS